MQIANDSLSALKQQVLQLRKKIESGDEPLAVELGIPKLLLEIEKTLTARTPNRQRLEQCAFGLFRLVTESYSFEQSELGQQLLDLRTKIRNYGNLAN